MEYVVAGVLALASMVGGFILGYRKGQEEGLEQVYKICDKLGLTAEEIEKIME